MFSMLKKNSKSKNESSVQVVSKSSSDIVVQPTDVLCGRSRKIFEQNRCFHHVIARYVERYRVEKSRRERSVVVLAVMNDIYGKGGRFLEYDSVKASWKIASDKVARNKVGHTMRDAAANKIKSILVIEEEQDAARQPRKHITRPTPVTSLLSVPDGVVSSASMPVIRGALDLTNSSDTPSTTQKKMLNRPVAAIIPSDDEGDDSCASRNVFNADSFDFDDFIEDGQDGPNVVTPLTSMNNDGDIPEHILASLDDDDDDDACGFPCFQSSAFGGPGMKMVSVEHPHLKNNAFGGPMDLSSLIPSALGGGPIKKPASVKSAPFANTTTPTTTTIRTGSRPLTEMETFLRASERLSADNVEDLLGEALAMADDL